MSARVTRRAVTLGTIAAGGAALYVGGRRLAELEGWIEAPEDGAPAPRAAMPLPPSLVTLSTGGILVHSAVAGPAESFAAAHLIELEDRFVLIDAGANRAVAQELRLHIAESGKRIERAILTGAAPGRVAAAAVFPEVTFETLPTIAADLERGAAAGGPPVPERLRRDLALGLQAVGSTRMQVMNFPFSAGPDALAVLFPDAGVAALGDLMVHGTHAPPGENRGRWIEALGGLAAEPGITALLPGYGPPAGRREFGRMRAYLERLDAALAAGPSPELAVAAMRLAYPRRKAHELLAGAAAGVPL